MPRLLTVIPSQNSMLVFCQHDILYCYVFLSQEKNWKCKVSKDTEVLLTSCNTQDSNHPDYIAVNLGILQKTQGQMQPKINLSRRQGLDLPLRLQSILKVVYSLGRSCRFRFIKKQDVFPGILFFHLFFIFFSSCKGIFMCCFFLSSGYLHYQASTKVFYINNNNKTVYF